MEQDKCIHRAYFPCRTCERNKLRPMEYIPRQPKPRVITPKVDLKKEWEKIKLLYGNKCAGCGLPEEKVFLQRDHMQSRKHRGRDTMSNYQPLCRECNMMKRDRSFCYLSRKSP